MKIDKKNLQYIIHDIFINHNLTNNDLFCNETYQSIVDLIFNTYKESENLICTSPSSMENLFEFIGNIKNDMEFDNQLYDIIHELLEKRENVIEEIYDDNDIKTISKQLDFLDSIPLPKQRSKEWYEFRNNRLTASDLGTVIGNNPYSSYKDLLLKKCGHEKPFISGPAIQHGVKYEDVAVAIYEKRTNVTIKEYGCVPHPNVEFFGASPDGICSKNSENQQYVGRMLEIKCPKSRQLNGFVPDYYEAQVQGQLEVCELEYCDFLECVIKEYNNKSEFLEDSLIENNTKSLVKRKNNMEKGVLLEYFDLDENKSKFNYATDENLKDIKELEKWESDIIDNIMKSDNFEYIATNYWKLEEYSVILVKRDRDWFQEAYKNIEQFWNDVLKYRKEGIDKIFEKYKKDTKSSNKKTSSPKNKNYRKKKAKVVKAKVVKKVSNTGFLYDSN
jgi:putative phage-type endonuclease